jgi:hypothetical protein
MFYFSNSSISPETGRENSSSSNCQIALTQKLRQLSETVITYKTGINMFVLKMNFLLKKKLVSKESIWKKASFEI